MRDLTGRYELPKHFRDEWEVRWKDLEKTYRDKYDQYIGKFTFDTRHYTGEYLVDLIEEEDGHNAMILDIGCGVNPFKKYFRNLIGVDPGDWGNADLQLDCNGAFNLFQSNSFDWILGIGFIHHCNTTEIHLAIEQMKSLVKPGGKIAMLVNHDKRPSLYPFDEETVETLTDLHELNYFHYPVEDYTDISKVSWQIDDEIQDGKIRKRLFWIWQTDSTQ